MENQTAMSVTRQDFENGLTYEAYKAQMTRNLDRLTANEERIRIDPEDLRAFAALPQPVKVVAIAEDWCGDVVANLPVLARLAQESGKLDVRVVLRDSTDLIDSYLNHGEFKSIPVFIFLDADFNEIGVFIERPDSVTAQRAEHRERIFAEHPELGDPETPADQMTDEQRATYQQLVQANRDETFDWANGEVVRELRSIVEKAAEPFASRSPTAPSAATSRRPSSLPTP